MALRATSLGARFVLVLSVAAVLPLSEVGIFGLIWGTVALLVLVVGLDFYTFSNRFMIANGKEFHRYALLRQGEIHAIAYVVFSLCAGIVILLGLLPAEVVLWTLALTISEHFAQETYRVLVTFDDQVYANAMLFLRAGGWAILAAGIIWLWAPGRSVFTVLTLWLAGSISAGVLGAARFKKLHLLDDGAWLSHSHILQGLRVSGRFFVGTISLSVVLTADRFLVGGLISLDVAGVYAVYVGMAAGLRALLDAGVLAFSLPRILRSGAAGDRQELKRLLLRTSILVLGLALLISTCIGAGGWLLSEVLLSHAYQEYFFMLPFALVAMVLMLVSMPSYQVLYAMGHDRVLLAANLVTVAVFFGGTFLLATRVPDLAVSVSCCLAMLGGLAVRGAAAFRATAG